MADKQSIKPSNLSHAVPAPESGAINLVKGSLKQVLIHDGIVNINEVFSGLKHVDIADVDLLLTFNNGDNIVIPNGALDALSNGGTVANFSDNKIALAELFKLVGIANPSKAGSLRIVTENIDANPPKAESETKEEPRSNDLPPPAPIIKITAGQNSGSGKGSGNGEGEVPVTINPIITPPPGVFTSGRRTITQTDVTDATGVGIPRVSADLYASSVFKVLPSGRADLPLGAYDSSATPDQLAARASPSGQATVEQIIGTSGNDTINFNPAFSASEAQWSKDLHITLNNFSTLSSIQIVFNASKIAQIPGFDLQGAGVTRDSPTSNSWHITPTPDMLLNGLDVSIVYDVTSNPVPIDFSADVIVNGNAGKLPFEVIQNLLLTWRDVVTQAEFTATSSTGDQLMVLPSAGVGVEIYAGSGNDTINAGAGPDIIHGGDGNDTINAATGNDVIDGGLGADAMNGGLGVDTATYVNSPIGVTATLDTTLGIANTGEAAGDTYVSIENLVGSNYNDILVGNAQNNVLTGGTGDDVLIGGLGADKLDGGAGNDTASYAYATGDVTVNLFTGTGTTGEANGDVLVSIENLVGGAGNDNFISGAGAVANNYDGGNGNDTVSYEPASDLVVASLTTGLTNVVQINDAIGDTFTNIENLTGTNFDDTLIGDGSVNILNGGSGNDTLEGLGGADQFVGGLGTDAVSYEHSSLGVVSSLTTLFGVGPTVTQTNDASGDTYNGVENLIGTSHNDTLIGSAGINLISGGDGDDTLEGMSGADVLDGGTGIDTATYAHATLSVIASLTAGLSGVNSQGDAAGDSLINIENLTGSNFNDTLIGDGINNILQGGDGDDVLEGMGGSDQLIGGNGINTASYEHSADQGSGTGVTVSLVDTALNTGDAAGDTYSNILNLLGSSFDDTLTGDAGNNILTGGAGNDILSGNTGVDTLYGQDGNDQLTDDLVGAALLSGGNGDDILTFTSNDGLIDTFDGGVGSDTINVNVAGSQFWIFNMQQSSTQNGGTIRLNWGAVFSSFRNIENVTASGTNSVYVYASNGDNVITGGSTGSDHVDYQYAVGGVNVNLNTGIVTGGSGSDTLSGIERVGYASDYNDVLIGNSANNYLNGGRGADFIDGGAGIDRALYDQFNSGSVTVSLMNSSLNNAMGIVFTDVAAGDVLTNIEELVGSGNNDNIYGNDGANGLYGNGGNDTLEGMLGADYLDGGSGTDAASYANAGLAAAGSATTGLGIGVTATLTTSFLVGPAVTNTGDALGDTFVNIESLIGSSYDDYLIGNNSANVLTGGDGNDVLEGLAGADVFNGGNGSDTVSYAHSTTGLVVDLNGTFANTNDASGDTFSSIENIIGTNFNDTIYGNGSDNVLDGGLGINTLDGGTGNDTASYSSATAAVSINLATNTVTGAGRTDTLVNIERVLGSNFTDTVTGSSGADWIDAGVGADTIDGMGGIDTLSYASAISGVSVTINGANNQADVLSNLENLFGSTYGDILTGDTGDNVIEGNLGDDTLNGGAGTDTVSYALSSSGVAVNISSNALLSIAANSATGGAGADSLSNFENIAGSIYADTLIGDGGNNVIFGDAGDDILIGGAGADTLTGGTGSDTVSYANASSAIAVLINGSGTLGDANGDLLAGIENITGSNFNDTITGDNSANLIDGGLGNDTINGAGGIDTVTYATAASAVVVNLGNAGANVSGGAGSDTLSNIENISGSNFADTITGNGGANTIEGGLGNDTLNGGAGTDTVSYAKSSGAVSVNIHTAIVSGVAANSSSGAAGSDLLSNFESIIGSSYADTLIGNSGSNQIDGGAGDDYLIGGSGADTLIGGLGTDTVSYENAGSAVAANLGGASLTAVGDAVGDFFSGIENFVGSAFNDTLHGDGGDNKLTGGAGNDLLRGYDGNDTIDMTQGNDTAYGGNGDDTFIVNAQSANLPSRIYGETNTSSLNGGGDTVKLAGLVSNQSYSLTNLANVTDTCEILDMRDSVNSSLTLSSASVQSFVDAGNSSRIWVKADVGDAVNVSLSAGETMQSFSVSTGTDYVIYNASSTQIAAIHWQTA